MPCPSAPQHSTELLALIFRTFWAGGTRHGASRTCTLHGFLRVQE
jgi:hypothetical protein